MIYEIKKCEFGKGMFATQDMIAGTFIGVFRSIVINKEQREIMQNTIVADYWFEWPDGTARLVLGDASFINHSFSPNLYKIWNTQDSVLFFTSKPINKGEQLFFDYWDGDEVDKWPNWLKRE